MYIYVLMQTQTHTHMPSKCFLFRSSNFSWSTAGTWRWSMVSVGHQRCWTNVCLARPWRHWPRFHVRVRLGGLGNRSLHDLSISRTSVPLGGREFSRQKLKVFMWKHHLTKSIRVRETYLGVVCGYQMVRWWMFTPTGRWFEGSLVQKFPRCSRRTWLEWWELAMCQSVPIPDMEFIKPGAEAKLSWKVLILTTRQIHTDHWLSKGIHQGRRGQRLSLAWNLQSVGSDSEEVASISVLLPALASEKSKRAQS